MSSRQTSIPEAQVLWENRLIVSSQEWRLVFTRPVETLGKTDLCYRVSVQLRTPFLLVHQLQLRLRKALLWFYLAGFPCWSQFLEGGISHFLRHTCQVMSEEPRTPSTRTQGWTSTVWGLPLGNLWPKRSQKHKCLELWHLISSHILPLMSPCSQNSFLIWLFVAHFPPFLTQ